MGPKILIIDDEPAFRDVFSEVCQMKYPGAAIQTAGTGPDAIRILERFSPDVVTTDMMHPGSHGYDLLKKIRMSPQLADIPIFLITGWEISDLETDFDEAFDEVFQKPPQIDELIAVMDRYISGSGSNGSKGSVTGHLQGNRRMLKNLLDCGGIDIEPGVILTSPGGKVPSGFDWGRVEGMMLGLAIGDSLGNSSEGMLPSKRKAVFGEIRNYLPSRHTGKNLGYPSDDTQLAFWTLEQLLENRRFYPEKLTEKISHRRIFGIGHTVKDFIRRCMAGTPWYEAGPESAGNGALMRIAPMLIPYLRSPRPGMLVDTALSAMITHNDSLSISSCLSYVTMLWDLIDLKKPPDQAWWLKKYTTETNRYEKNRAYSPRGGIFADYNGRGCEYVDKCISFALKNELSVLDACNAWYSGAYLLETVPSVIYILMRYGHDPEEAIIRAINDTKDNDTIAAIVGAAVGALHGKSAFPPSWTDGLTGRTQDADEGKIFELLEEARRAFSTSN